MSRRSTAMIAASFHPEQISSPTDRSRPDSRALLDALRRGARIGARTAVVVAHPDDETIGMGARLGKLSQLTLMHLTDGAPQAPEDAERAGFMDTGEYRAARAAELDDALAVLGIAPQRIDLGLHDQSAVYHLAELARALRGHLQHVNVVFTHPYEGGHPDHDAAAFAVQSACRLLARQGKAAPVRLEFASYHLHDGERVAGAFWPDGNCPSCEATISPAELARKRTALACFRTQAEVVAWFEPEREVYRAAPVYDFAAPPPPGAALYDQWGWKVTAQSWRTHAQDASAVLQRGEDR